MESADQDAAGETCAPSKTSGVHFKARNVLRQYGFGIAVLGILAWALTQALVVDRWYDWFEKRVMVVTPGQLVRGAFQRPDPLRRIIAREHIKTIVTVAALDDEDPRFVDQARVVQKTGVRWVILPILDSRPSLDQMAQAADLLADRELRPVFFHCIAGHHRTSLALAAYRIRHEGWSAERAWREVSSVRWARPNTDVFDHRQIEAFAAKYGNRIARR